MLYAKSSKSELREKLDNIGEEKLSALYKLVSDVRTDTQTDNVTP